MNESMNFGNLSFNTVSNDSTNSTVAENNISATNNVAIDNNENNQENAKPQISDSGLSFSTSTVVKKDNYEKEADNFSSIEFGPLQKYLDDDDITDISYSNGGQLWLKSLSKGV